VRSETGSASSAETSDGDNGVLPTTTPLRVLPTTSQLSRKPVIPKIPVLLANNSLWSKGRLLPHKGKRAMLTTYQINDLHHLYWAEHWPIRKIEHHLGMSWRTIKKYLEAPAQTPAMRSRVSKLDPFKPTIAELLEKDARATAAVIEQRLPPSAITAATASCASKSTKFSHSRHPSAPLCAWNPRLASASRWTGVTSAHTATMATSVSRMPSR
jgi:hypothetical protein